MSTEPVFDNLFLSVGAMKAGTTWIYDAMHRHPGIHFSQEKEIHYFYAHYVKPGILADKSRMRRAKGYLAFDPEVSMRNVLQRRVRWTANWLSGPVDDDWFNRLFLYRGRATWVADFSNLNALVPADGWREIHGKTRKLRVLYTLREPMDRLWSHVRFHLKMQGKSDLLDGWNVDELAHHIQTGDYLEHTDYVTAIRRLQAGLPAECLHVEFFDRISGDPRGFVRDVEDFLDLNHHELPEGMINKVVNPSPPRPMPEGLVDRLAPFIREQHEGLNALGITPPAAWDHALNR